METSKPDVIIKAISEARAITRKGYDVNVYITSENRLDAIYPRQLRDILLKLQDDEGILTLKSFPKHLVYDDFDNEVLESMVWAKAAPQGVYFTVGIHENFDKWASKHMNIGQVSGEEPLQVQEKREISESPDCQIVYEITYTRAREILLNEVFQLARPDFNSENDNVFDYLYQHPNETFTVNQIKEHIGGELDKSLHKIIENLGFRGDLRKAFFDVSQDSIRFKNPVTRKDLADLGITRIKLS